MIWRSTIPAIASPDGASFCEPTCGEPAESMNVQRFIRVIDRRISYWSGKAFAWLIVALMTVVPWRSSSATS